MAVYCAPMITGKVDRTRGYSTNHFKPGYTKPKHTINPNMSIKRSAGEQIGQPEMPVERRAKIIMQNLLDEELSISQLEEFEQCRRFCTVSTPSPAAISRPMRST